MATTEKVDFKKSLDSYQARSVQLRTFEVPPLGELWWAKDHAGHV